MYSRRGFTLLEVIVVMAIVGILVTVAVPRFAGYTKDAQIATMKIDAGLLEQSAIQYVLINENGWPVGDIYEPLNDILLIIDDLLLHKGLTVSSADLSGCDVFREIDEHALSVYIRSTSNPVDMYFIIDSVDELDGYSNELEGMVFSKKVFSDRYGVVWSGMYCEDN